MSHHRVGEPNEGPPRPSMASILASGESNVMASTLVTAEEEHSTTRLAAAVSSTMASTLTVADSQAHETQLPRDPASSSPGASSQSSPIRPAKPFLDISEMEDTLRDAQLSEAFREFLRAFDKAQNSSPEVKGRFERQLDFILKVLEIYDLPQGELDHQINLTIELRHEFFSSPTQTISGSSQGALRTLKDHLNQIASQTMVPNLELIRPVFEEIYRKMQIKHNHWKKTYQPTTSLQTLMCMMS